MADCAHCIDNEATGIGSWRGRKYNLCDACRDFLKRAGRLPPPPEPKPLLGPQPQLLVPEEVHQRRLEQQPGVKSDRDLLGRPK